MNYLRITDNRGQIIRISEDTDPKKSVVDELIMQEESKLENQLGHAWKETRAITENLDLPMEFDWFFGTPIHLRHRKVRELSADADDFLRIIYPQENQDILPKINDWYRMNYDLGILYMQAWVWHYRREKRIQISYRYGDTDVPRWVKRATIQSTAITLIETSLSMSKIQTQEGVDLNRLVEQWRRDIDKVVENNAEIVAVPYM